jgi:hypothetical protein
MFHYCFDDVTTLVPVFQLLLFHVAPDPPPPAATATVGRRRQGTRATFPCCPRSSASRSHGDRGSSKTGYTVPTRPSSGNAVPAGSSWTVAKVKPSSHPSSHGRRKNWCDWGFGACCNCAFHVLQMVCAAVVIVSRGCWKS